MNEDTGLSTTALEALAAADVTVAQLHEHYEMGDTWTGAPCGCPDPGCLYSHHPGGRPHDCGCLAAELSNAASWKRALPSAREATDEFWDEFYREVDSHYPEPDETAELRQRPDIAEAIQLTWQLYRIPNCCTGGPLHVQLDDHNLQDRFLEKPYNGVAPDGTPHYNAEEIALAERVLALLRPMTMKERLVVASLLYRDPEGR